MNVHTGKLLSRYQWTELPIPDSIIKAVNTRGPNDRKLKEDDETPEMFEFSIRNRQGIITPINDNEPNDEQIPHQEVDPTHTDLHSVDHQDTPTITSLQQQHEVPDTASISQ